MGDEAYRCVSVGEIDGLLSKRQQAPASGLCIEPLAAGPNGDDTASGPPYEGHAMLAHRWTLEELWGFVLKLDRLENLLGRTETGMAASPTETDDEAPCDTADKATFSEDSAIIELLATEKNASRNLLPEEGAAGKTLDRSKENTYQQHKPVKKRVSKLAVAAIIVGVLALLAIGIYRLTS